MSDVLILSTAWMLYDADGTFLENALDYLDARYIDDTFYKNVFDQKNCLKVHFIELQQYKEWGTNCTKFLYMVDTYVHTSST